MRRDELTNEVYCDEHQDCVCGYGIRVGTLQRRYGVLCSVDDDGRLYLRAPRRSDVALAQRVVEAVASATRAGQAPIFPADITSIREKS